MCFRHPSLGTNRWMSPITCSWRNARRRFLLMFFACFYAFHLAEKKNEFSIVQPIHGHDDDNMVNVFVMSMLTIV